MGFYLTCSHTKRDLLISGDCLLLNLNRQVSFSKLDGQLVSTVDRRWEALGWGLRYGSGRCSSTQGGKGKYNKWQVVYKLPSRFLLVGQSGSTRECCWSSQPVTVKLEVMVFSRTFFKKFIFGGLKMFLWWCNVKMTKNKNTHEYYMKQLPCSQSLSM